MEDKFEEKPEVAEQTAVQPEQEKVRQEKPENKNKVLTPQEIEKRRKLIVIPIFILIFLGVMY